MNPTPLRLATLLLAAPACLLGLPAAAQQETPTSAGLDQPVPWYVGVGQGFFYDTNVYDAEYLSYLATRMAPGQVFAGTDYPYLIMQKDPARWVRSLALPVEVERSICAEAAGRFMAEDLIAVIEAEA